MSMYIVTSNISVIQLMKFSQSIKNKYVKKCICLSYSLCKSKRHIPEGHFNQTNRSTIILTDDAMTQTDIFEKMKNSLAIS